MSYVIDCKHCDGYHEPYETCSKMTRVHSIAGDMQPTTSDTVWIPTVWIDDSKNGVTSIPGPDFIQKLREEGGAILPNPPQDEDGSMDETTYFLQELASRIKERNALKAKLRILNSEIDKLWKDLNNA